MNSFQKVCGSIDYNTYANIQNALGATTISLAVANGVLHYPALTDFNYALIGIYLALYASRGIKNTGDVMQIRELYQEFINNYNKLNMTFGLNNPIQIHTMFSYLLYEGYLSKDKKFDFSAKQARDIEDLYGANVIIGNAVCRHISSMLTDILNNYGIESSMLGVYSKEYKIDINVLKQPKYTKDELINWVRTHITDEQSYEVVMAFIDELVVNQNKHIEISSELAHSKNPLKRIVGNHLITYAFKDGNSSFLDPTQGRIYRMSDSNNGMLYDDISDNISIKTISSMVFNGLGNYLRMRERLLSIYPSVSLEEEQQIIAETKKICTDNTDIFEQFYEDNKELYNEISSGLLKIRKKKFIIL